MQSKILIIGANKPEKKLAEVLKHNSKSILVDLFNGHKENILSLVEKAQVYLPDLVVATDPYYFENGLTECLLLHGLLSFAVPKRSNRLLDKYEFNFDCKKDVINFIGLCNNTDIILINDITISSYELDSIKSLLRPIFNSLNEENAPYFGFFSLQVIKNKKDFQIIGLDPGIGSNIASKILPLIKTDIYPLMFLLAKNKAIDENYWQEKLEKPYAII